MDIPPTEFATGSDVNAAAMLRNHAFIVKDVINKNRKKMLSIKFSKVIGFAILVYLQKLVLMNEWFRLKRQQTRKWIRTALSWNPTMKYNTIEKMESVRAVIGMSTRVNARVSTKG